MTSKVEYKTVWHLQIADHVGYSVYSPNILMGLVSEYRGRIESVEQRILRYQGSWNAYNRTVTTVATKDVTNEVLTVRNAQ